MREDDAVLAIAVVDGGVHRLRTYRPGARGRRDTGVRLVTGNDGGAKE